MIDRSKPQPWNNDGPNAERAYNERTYADERLARRLHDEELDFARERWANDLAAAERAVEAAYNDRSRRA